mmetsp:Transcript_43487/g.118117  ORF Transcript_43487/g.118117 Transcript_43487/m.118117 type:complete len:187 (-) Transcript_43487:445-1005(-)
MVRTKAVAKKSSAAGRAWLKEQQQQKLKWASTENDDDSQWSMRGMTLDLGPKFLIGKDVFTNPKSLVAKPSARGLRPGGLADHVLWAKNNAREVKRFRVQTGLAVDPNDQHGAERHTDMPPNMQWCAFIMLASGRRDLGYFSTQTKALKAFNKVAARIDGVSQKLIHETEVMVMTMMTMALTCLGS